jgi:hypothetical protein
VSLPDFARFEKATSDWMEQFVKDPQVLDIAGRSLTQFLVAKKIWDEAMAQWLKACAVLVQEQA